MERESPSGIEVLVVGCGLGGLFAAIELYRQGHSVRIIELKSKVEGLGELSIPTRRLPVMLMRYRRLCWNCTVSYEAIQEMARNDGDVLEYRVSALHDHV